MGLLDSVTQAIKDQYQTTKRGLGLLMSDPNQFASETAARYFPTKEEEQQFRLAQRSGADITQTPYYQKMFNLAQFQGSIKPKGLLTPNQQAIADIRQIQSERIPTDLSWVNNPVAPNPPKPSISNNPFGKGIVYEKIGNSTVSYQLGDDGILKIFSLRTPQSKRGQGSATEAMNQIVQKADKYGIPIKLDASPLDKKTRLDKLVNFYQKFGFEPTGEKVNVLGEPVMMRKPK